MNECKKCQRLFENAIYAKLDESEQLFLEAHLRECPDCRKDYAEFVSTLKIMERRDRQEPDTGFWDGYWERLAARMQKENVVPVSQEEHEKKAVKLWGFAPRWVFQAAAAMILIVVGIFLGRMFFSHPSSGLQTAGIPETDLQPDPDVQLVQQTYDYIDRSKRILLAIVNFDPEQADPYTLDLPYKQATSKQLVQEAGLLKQGLAESRQQRLHELVTDLEAILIQIANLESEPGLVDIDIVQTGVESRGIFFKIHLENARRSHKSSGENKSKKF